MSAESEEKKEIETKLMDDNERDKSYGTEGAVVLSIESQRSITDRDEGTANTDQQNRIKRNRSLLMKMRSYESKDSHIGFLNKIVSFIFDTIVGIIALLVANIIQVTCIVIGSVYVHDCGASPGIPVILIVSGSINVVICVIEGIKRRINRNSQMITKLNVLINSLQIASSLAFGAWMIIVYDAVYPTYDDPKAETYCNRTLFLFAFWLLNVYLMLIVFVLFITCCCCCFAAGVVAKKTVDEVAEATQRAGEP